MTPAYTIACLVAGDGRHDKPCETSDHPPATALTLVVELLPMVTFFEKVRVAMGQMSLFLCTRELGEAGTHMPRLVCEVVKCGAKSDFPAAARGQDTHFARPPGPSREIWDLAADGILAYPGLERFFDTSGKILAVAAVGRACPETPRVPCQRTLYI